MKNRGFSINHKIVQKLMGALCLKCNIMKVSYRSYKGEVGEEFIASLKEYSYYYNNKNRLNGKSPVEYQALAQKT